MGINRCPVAFGLTMSKKAIQLKQAGVVGVFLYFFFLIKINIQDIFPPPRPSPSPRSWVLLAPAERCHRQPRDGLSPAPSTIATAATVAPWLAPAEATVLVNTENEKQLFVSLQEYQKNKKMVSSPCGPKAFSLFTFSHADGNPSLPFSKELFQFISLMLCRPVGISYNYPSPVVDQDKSSDGATQKKKKRRSIAAPDTSPP